MQVGAAYGDIGLIGSERQHDATRTVHITVLPDQQVSVVVNAEGILGGFNANVRALVDGGMHNLGDSIMAAVEPGVLDLEIGVRVISRGGLVLMRELQYEVVADPPSPLHDSVGDYDASIASLTRAAGLTQRAIQFTGEPDAVEIPDLGWRGADNRGVSLWVRDPADGPIMRWAENLSIEVISGIINIRYLGTDYEVSPVSVDDGDWHHLVVWVDSSDVLAWLDSLDPVEISISVDTGGDWSCFLGRDDSRYWYGVIDEIVFFDQSPASVELLQMRRLQRPEDGSLYADSIVGGHVLPIVRDGQYPANPRDGQVVIVWDGSTASKEVYVDGDWRSVG